MNTRTLHFKLLIASLCATAFALPIVSFAQEATTSRGTTFTACQQDAVELRDTTIGEARSIYSEAMNKALEYRKLAVKEALGLPNEEEQNEAKKKVADEYRTMVKKAQDTLTKSRTEAWDLFEDQVETCRNVKKEGLKSDVADLKRQAHTNETSTTSLEQGTTTEAKEMKKGGEKSFKESFREQLEALRSLFRK